MSTRAVLAGVALIVSAAGCGGSDPAPRGGTSSTGEFPVYITQAESTFHPGDYGVETWEVDTLAGQTAAGAGDAGVDSAGVAEPDTIPGFRVQVSITGDIDGANGLKDSLSVALEKEWVYVVYHPPYYKIRVGNFADRFAAGEMLDRLRRHGFPDAWIVPDRVVRNPPPKPAHPTPDSTDVAVPPR